MDYSQIVQQSLQAMLANNPQLILQFLQQTSPPASGSSGPPLTISPQPSAPGSSTPPSSSSESSSGSGSGSVALPVPPISQTVPVSAPAPLPSTSTLTASLHSQPAPPITSYISPVHMLSSVRASGSSSGHSPLAPPASPFHSLTTIERANHDRNEHAAQVSTSTDSGRRRRRRGAGRKPPRLTEVVETPKLEDTIATASDGTPVVSLIVLVYPPRPTVDECNFHNIPIELHHYVQNRDAFQTVLKTVGLSYQFDNLPLSTKVVNLLEAVQSSLVQAGWVFPPSTGTEPTIFCRHERLPIQLLRFVGRGNINNTAKTPRLITGKVESEDMTLAQIVGNITEYGVAKYAVTPDKKFLLHTIIRSPNVSLNVNLFEKGLGSDDALHTHHCLSKRIYGIFRSDADALVYEGYRALNEAEIELGCRRDVDEDAAELRVVAQMLNVEPSSSSFNTQGPLDLTPAMPTTIRIHGSPEGSESAPLKILWTEDWAPHVAGNEILHGTLNVDDRSPVFTFISERHRQLFDTEELGFTVKGQNTQELVEAFTKVVRKANVDGDFTTLLSEHRHFRVVAIEPDGVERYITSGPGVEKEVMTLFFKTSFEAASDLLTRVSDEYATLATVPMQSASDMSNIKKDELTHFGSVVGLSLIHGTYPDTLNPLLLIYLLNACNLSSMTKALVLEFFPTLYHTLIEWLALDYRDNSSLPSFERHFATYHNLQVSALRNRSERLHHSLAWTMLHNVIIGPESADHPYFVAFKQGFLLPCKRVGLNLSEISRLFCGGTGEFVVSLLETRITGNYNMLRMEHSDHTGDSVHSALRNALSTIFPALSEKGFPAVFREFLEGSGLPPPLTVQGLQGRFSEVVSLQDVSKKGYRMKMFCWASTGVPHLILDGNDIEVCLVPDDDTQYLSQHTQGEERALYLNNGTCCFKTCTRTMFIPASYLLRLLQVPSNDPQAVMDSISSWLLLQILDGIDNYNIL
ncbi:hypothetical protein EV360DRAFT_71247 [Lentinula raphanica]|nr:hypothetical protein EV360DRAFT_71247 [Lentinula raphanica]